MNTIDLRKVTFLNSDSAEESLKRNARAALVVTQDALLALIDITAVAHGLKPKMGDHHWNAIDELAAKGFVMKLSDTTVGLV